MRPRSRDVWNLATVGDVERLAGRQWADRDRAPTDAVVILRHLFAGQAVACLRAGDVNDRPKKLVLTVIDSLKPEMLDRAIAMALWARCFCAPPAISSRIR